MEIYFKDCEKTERKIIMNKKTTLIIVCIAISTFFLGGAFLIRTGKDKTGNDKNSKWTAVNGTSNNFTRNTCISSC